MWPCTGRDCNNNNNGRLLPVLDGWGSWNLARWISAVPGSRESQNSRLGVHRSLGSHRLSVRASFLRGPSSCFQRSKSIVESSHSILHWSDIPNSNPFHRHSFLKFDQTTIHSCDIQNCNLTWPERLALYDLEIFKHSFVLDHWNMRR